MQTMTQSEEKFKTGTSYLMPFEKMHGLGNDFVVVNIAHLPENSNTEFEQDLCRKVCDRNRGIGADGLILLEDDETTDFRMIYFNSLFSSFKF